MNKVKFQKVLEVCEIFKIIKDNSRLKILDNETMCTDMGAVSFMFIH